MAHFSVSQQDRTAACEHPCPSHRCGRGPVRIPERESKVLVQAKVLPYPLETLEKRLTCSVMKRTSEVTAA